MSQTQEILNFPWLHLVAFNLSKRTTQERTIKAESKVPLPPGFLKTEIIVQKAL